MEEVPNIGEGWQKLPLLCGDTFPVGGLLREARQREEHFGFTWATQGRALHRRQCAWY
jgi:hypothetical protein